MVGPVGESIAAGEEAAAAAEMNSGDLEATEADLGGKMETLITEVVSDEKLRTRLLDQVKEVTSSAFGQRAGELEREAAAKVAAEADPEGVEKREQELLSGAMEIWNDQGVKVGDRVKSLEEAGWEVKATLSNCDRHSGEIDHERTAYVTRHIDVGESDQWQVLVPLTEHSGATGGRVLDYHDPVDEQGNVLNQPLLDKIAGKGSRYPKAARIVEFPHFNEGDFERSPHHQDIIGELTDKAKANQDAPFANSLKFQGDTFRWNGGIKGKVEVEPWPEK